MPTRKPTNQGRRKDQRRPPTRKAVNVRPRRSSALSAELDAFLVEVVDAISGCMVARRWNDLDASMRAYALAIGALDPARLFYAAIAHKVLRHVLTLTDRSHLAECLTSVKGSLDAIREGRTLEAAITMHRKALENRDAYELFERLSADNSADIH